MITYIPSFLPRSTADAEFSRLWDELAWVQRDQAPRREYWMNVPNIPYTYGSGAYARTYEAQPWDDFIRFTMLELNEEFNAHLDCCFVNGYADQRQHLGWHADDSPEMNPSEPVIVISLGAEREIWYRDKANHDDITRVLLGHGSAFVMPAGMQQTHGAFIISLMIQRSHSAVCWKSVMIVVRNMNTRLT